MPTATRPSAALPGPPLSARESSAALLVGAGANLGDRAATLEAALLSLAERGIVWEAVSSVWESEPFGHQRQPDFLNLVALGRAPVPPDEASARALLALFQSVERELGRVPRGRWRAREIDLDLLALGDLVLASPDLTVPHAGIPERSFVLSPLCEIAPDWRHPALGRTAAELSRALAAAPEPLRLRRAGPPPRVPTAARLAG